VILAGFGEHGKDALQEMLTVPVLDIAESAAHIAHLIGRRFSVVTTLARSIPPIEDRLLLAGLKSHCASIRACGLGTAEVDADPQVAVAAIVDEAARAVSEDGAEVICLGCAGMAGVTAAISAKLGVPAVDGVAAAVALAESLVRLGLRTSKVGASAPGPANPRTHWPLSRSLGLGR
jgi:allantoin racemase